MSDINRSFYNILTISVLFTYYKLTDKPSYICIKIAIHSENVYLNNLILSLYRLVCLYLQHITRTRIRNQIIVQSTSLRITLKMAQSIANNSCGNSDQDLLFMAEAIREARNGLAEGGIPIGCVIVRNGQVVARGHNRRIQRDSVILHAEMDCIENAGRQIPSFYGECTIYTTLSPCVMCSGAIRLYGISRVVIGENRNFCGDDILLAENNVKVDVLDSIECRELLADYIAKNRSTWYEDIGRKEQ